MAGAYTETAKSERGGQPVENVQWGTTGWSVIQPSGEILLQICCRRSDSRSLTQLFVAGRRQPRTPTPCRGQARKPGRSQILAAPSGRSHYHMIARAPARLHYCIDGDCKLMHYPSDGLLYCGRLALVSAHEAPAPSGFGDDSEMDRSGR
jgi:hypothetical protein